MSTVGVIGGGFVGSATAGGAEPVTCADTSAATGVGAAAPPVVDGLFVSAAVFPDAAAPAASRSFSFAANSVSFLCLRHTRTGAFLSEATLELSLCFPPPCEAGHSAYHRLI